MAGKLLKIRGEPEGARSGSEDILGLAGIAPHGNPIPLSMVPKNKLAIVNTPPYRAHSHL